MSSAGAVHRAAVPVSNARAEASRRNGAKSRGPKTPEGKARSSQNALKHGMRAEKHVVLPDEDAAEFKALEAALIAELAPQGALQSVLARRIARAAWRLERGDRIEVELFEECHIPSGGIGLALIRDGNGTRSFETLLRYRGAALAELWRALRTLKALQAEQAATRPVRGVEAEPAAVPLFEPKGGRAGTMIEIAPGREKRQSKARRNPKEPEARGNPGDFEPAPPADEPEEPQAGTAYARPSEPERRPARPQPRPQPDEPKPNEPAPAANGGCRVDQRLA